MYKIMHDIVWVMIFLSRVRWLADDFHKWSCHVKIVGEWMASWPIVPKIWVLGQWSHQINIHELILIIKNNTNTMPPGN